MNVQVIDEHTCKTKGIVVKLGYIYKDSMIGSSNKPVFFRELAVGGS